MKVVFQNGCNHILSRDDVESALKLLPSTWVANIQSVTLFQGQGPKICITHHMTERVVGVGCPNEHSSISKEEALEELFVAFACIKDRGRLPVRLSKSAREIYRNEALGILDTI